ncbi:hypothetical protein BKA61DRAFT_56060 [Leptodontidium sp. MPI-SDFR-AT-0119]|nr:hypothetical protein BKA61DRAFT_56060 [Leptodontidium sp. MPI-SDFR-AT-0119]
MDGWQGVNWYCIGGMDGVIWAFLLACLSCLSCLLSFAYPSFGMIRRIRFSYFRVRCDELLSLIESPFSLSIYLSCTVQRERELMDGWMNTGDDCSRSR